MCVYIYIYIHASIYTQGSSSAAQGLLAKYAQHLLDKNKKLEAVQLYRKASSNNSNDNHNKHNNNTTGNANDYK